MKPATANSQDAVKLHPATGGVELPPVEVIDRLNAAELVDFATAAAALHARAMARLTSLSTDRARDFAAADYLTADEAAALLRVTPEWVYRKAASWAFASKLAPKILRIQRNGLLRWIEQRSRR